MGRRAAGVRAGHTDDLSDKERPTNGSDRRRRSRQARDQARRFGSRLRPAGVAGEMMTLRQFAKGIETTPATTSWYLADLGEARGHQELYTRQSPQTLKVLR